MAFLKVALFVSFACLVNSYPPVTKFNLDDTWKKTFSIFTNVTVKDGSQKEIAFTNITIATWNYTSNDYQLVSDVVKQHLNSIPVDPEVLQDSLEVYEGLENKLPLVFTMSQTEVMFTGPDTVRGTAIQFDVSVYAKNYHSKQVLSFMKHFSPAF